MPPPLPRPRRPSAPTPPHPAHPTPLLRLKIQDLSHPGARSFLSSVDAAGALKDAVHTVLDLLFPGQYRGSWPGTRSVTLVLGSFGGVAYTQGRALDDDHKEIHLSSDYISSIKPELLKREITGVLVHEMVHCWQWNGCGTAPGGLIEGVADWVRLRADLSPPHWKRTTGDRWDVGYQVTAWFLDWLEDKYGAGTVARLNHILKDTEYEEKKYWRDRCGLPEDVHGLWKEYKRWLADEDKTEKGKDEEEHKKENQENREGANSATEAEAMGSTETGKRDDYVKGEKDDSEQVQVSEDHSQPYKGERAENELHSDWTELTSSGLELKKRG